MATVVPESLGGQVRRRRRKLGLTLDDLALRTSISKPYLSLIETNRVQNPPSDEKLRRIEQSLGFGSGELVSQAQLMRTPRDVRAMLSALLVGGGAGAGAAAAGTAGDGVRIDGAYLSGALRDWVEQRSGNVERVVTNAVPVINKVSAGYPKDFTDMGYPPRVADDYVSCPEVNDKDAFAARVHGDSMEPKYREGDIVIFSPGQSVKSGEDCFVRFVDGHTTFKRVFFESDEGGEAVIRLQPRNERYRPMMTRAEEVSGLYRAVYRYEAVNGS